MKTSPFKTYLTLMSLLLIAVFAAALLSACTSKPERNDNTSTTRRGSY